MLRPNWMDAVFTVFFLVLLLFVQQVLGIGLDLTHKCLSYGVETCNDFERCCRDLCDDSYVHCYQTRYYRVHPVNSDNSQCIAYCPEAQMLRKLQGEFSGAPRMTLNKSLSLFIGSLVIVALYRLWNRG